MKPQQLLPRTSDARRALLRQGCVLLSAAACGQPVWAATLAVPRHALVIGNAAYSGNELPNALRDARAIAVALKPFDFEVRLLEDTSRAELLAGIDAFLAGLAARPGVGLLYFAGHGMQLRNDNFVFPVDTKLRTPGDVLSQGIAVDGVIDRLSRSGSRLGVVVLDACRDNPFGRRLDFVGLAPKDAPASTIVAYATEAGNTAQDGDVVAGQGLYTRYLLKELARSDATFDDIFKRVRFAVWQASNGTQIPSYSNGAEGDFSLARGFSASAVDMGARARAFTEEKAVWDRIRDSRDPKDFFRFIDQFPGSGISELAQAVLERLSRRQIRTQAFEGQAEQRPADSRFRVGDRYEMRVSVNGVADRTTTVDVIEVSRDVARYTGVFRLGQIGESTVAGAVISDGSSVYDPPYVLVPGGEYQVGKRWSGRNYKTYLGKTQWQDYFARVVARETIKIPEGAVETYRVDFRFELESGVTLRSRSWVQPDWGIGLRTEFQYQDESGHVRNALRELISRRRGNG